MVASASGSRKLALTSSFSPLSRWLGPSSSPEGDSSLPFLVKEKLASVSKADGRSPRHGDTNGTPAGSENGSPFREMAGFLGLLRTQGGGSSDASAGHAEALEPCESCGKVRSRASGCDRCGAWTCDRCMFQRVYVACSGDRPQTPSVCKSCLLAIEFENRWHNHLKGEEGGIASTGDQRWNPRQPHRRLSTSECGCGASELLAEARGLPITCASVRWPAYAAAQAAISVAAAAATSHGAAADGTPPEKRRQGEAANVTSPSTLPAPLLPAAAQMSEPVTSASVRTAHAAAANPWATAGATALPLPAGEAADAAPRSQLPAAGQQQEQRTPLRQTTAAEVATASLQTPAQAQPRAAPATAPARLVQAPATSGAPSAAGASALSEAITPRQLATEAAAAAAAATTTAAAAAALRPAAKPPAAITPAPPPRPVPAAAALRPRLAAATPVPVPDVATPQNATTPQNAATLQNTAVQQSVATPQSWSSAAPPATTTTPKPALLRKSSLSVRGSAPVMAARAAPAVAEMAESAVLAVTAVTSTDPDVLLRRSKAFAYLLTRGARAIVQQARQAAAAEFLRAEGLAALRDVGDRDAALRRLTAKAQAARREAANSSAANHASAARSGGGGSSSGGLPLAVDAAARGIAVTGALGTPPPGAPAPMRSQPKGAAAAAAAAAAGAAAASSGRQHQQEQQQQHRSGNMTDDERSAADPLSPWRGVAGAARMRAWRNKAQLAAPSPQMLPASSSSPGGAGGSSSGGGGGHAGGKAASVMPRPGNRAVTSPAAAAAAAASSRTAAAAAADRHALPLTSPHEIHRRVSRQQSVDMPPPELSRLGRDTPPPPPPPLGGEVAAGTGFVGISGLDRDGAGGGMIVEPAPVRLAKTWDALLAMLSATPGGISVIKHPRKGRPRVVRLTMGPRGAGGGGMPVEAEAEVVQLRWGEGARRLALRNIASVLEGQLTPVLKRSGDPLKQHLYASLVCSQRSLDLEFASRRQRDAFTASLKAFLREAKSASEAAAWEYAGE